MKEISKLIAILVFILGLVAFIGGVYVAILNKTATTEITLLGQKVTSQSVGVVLMFIGGVVSYFSFKNILNLPWRDVVTTNKMFIYVADAENKEEFIFEAIIFVLLPMSNEGLSTDITGKALLLYTSDKENKKVKINVQREGYEPIVGKEIILKNDERLDIYLKKK